VRLATRTDVSLIAGLAQDRVEAQAVPPRATLTYGSAETYSIAPFNPGGQSEQTGVGLIARTVEITIGSAVILADVADLRMMVGPGTPFTTSPTMPNIRGYKTEIELRGNVRLRTPLSVRPK
jgi:hypothetical protein